MADWYVSSAAWTAIPQFAASTAYTVGQIVRPLTAPAVTAQYAFRCTTAGTSGAEPSWPTADNGTVTTGGATFTNVSGHSAYGWSAAFGTLGTAAVFSPNRLNAGDRVFLSSDHSESGVSTNYGGSNNGGVDAWGLIQYISVNRAGSVPPVAADITSGAAITLTATANIDARVSQFWQGITFTNSSSGAAISLNSSGCKTNTFKNCAFVLTGNGVIQNANSCKVVFDNTTVQFGGTGGSIRCGASAPPFNFVWINTPSAIQGSNIPTNLFTASGAGGGLITCRGADLSVITTCLYLVNINGGSDSKLLFDSCRIAAAVQRLSTPGTNALTGDELELVNCYDGTNVINERYTNAGAITTDRSTYLTSGAQDDVSNYSLKLVSSSRNDFAVFPLDVFAFDVENTVTGVSKTATVEIVSSGTLNNNDIRLLLEYMGTSGNSLASFADSLASVLTAASALPSSSNTWTNSPSTPVKQLLQVTFTPQRAGRVRGFVRLGKPSTTVWANPQIAIA